MVIANLLHCFSKVASSRGIAYAFHCIDPVHVRKYVRIIAAHNKARKRDILKRCFAAKMPLH
jgi:hypothetical protein